MSQSPSRLALLLIPLVLACFGLLPKADAVVPAPDGGYPGFNTAEGQNALFSLTTGQGNTAVGWLSLRALTQGSFNTAIGAGTLLANIGDRNTATGAAALLLNTTGQRNTANGALALFSNTIGSNNTANGQFALYNNTTGDVNTAMGDGALFANTTGTANIALGVQAGSSVTTASGVICIGNFVGANVDNSCFIGNIFGAGAISGDPVFITSAGKLGTVTIPSAARFKEEIEPMNKASDVFFALKPVTFRYKEEFDPRRIPQFGLVAEEVEKVSPDLVKRDHDGKLQTVRYEAVNAMLLNEFLKEHKAFVEEQGKVQEQGATIARLEQQVAALSAGLQKVSAQLAAASPSGGGLEASKFATGRIRGGGPAPQMVNNP